MGKIKRAVKKSRSPFLLCFLLPNTRQSVRPHQAPTPDSSRQPLTFGRAQGHRPTVLYAHLNFHLASCDAICCQQAIPLTLPNHSKKPWQQGHPKKPSDKAIAHSAQGRLATHIPLAIPFAGQRMASCYKSDLRCAEPPSAFESGIFCFLFFAVEKKSVAARRRHRRSQRIKGNPHGGRTKRLRRATHALYGTLVPHSSLGHRPHSGTSVVFPVLPDSIAAKMRAMVLRTSWAEACARGRLLRMAARNST